MQVFNLIPFPSNTTPKISITGDIKRMENHLSVRYEMRGNVEQIAFPTRSELPTRKDDLWKTTCFELFLAIPDKPHYWEFNMSPSGDWNVYKMDAYRKIGFREEMSFEQIQFKARKDANEFVLSAYIDLNPLFEEDQILEGSMTAIIQTEDGNETYWAIKHPGEQADFHLRESFTIDL